MKFRKIPFQTGMTPELEKFLFLTQKIIKLKYNNINQVPWHGKTPKKMKEGWVVKPD